MILLRFIVWGHKYTISLIVKNPYSGNTKYIIVCDKYKMYHFMLSFCANKDINAPYRNYSVIANMIAIWHPGMSIFTSYYKQRLEYNINKSLIGKDNCLVLI